MCMDLVTWTMVVIHRSNISKCGKIEITRNNVNTIYLYRQAFELWQLIIRTEYLCNFIFDLTSSVPNWKSAFMIVSKGQILKFSFKELGCQDDTLVAVIRTIPSLPSSFLPFLRRLFGLFSMFSPSRTFNLTIFF